MLMLMWGLNSQRLNSVTVKTTLLRWRRLTCNSGRQKTTSAGSFCHGEHTQEAKRCLSPTLFQVQGFIFGQTSSTSPQELHKRKTGRDFEAAAAHLKSSPSTGRQASLRSPRGCSIPSMVYLCIHIGGEWEWSLLSIVASLNIFRKPSIVSASSILGSINSKMWTSVFSLLRMCAINTRRTEPWMPSGMISQRVECHVSEAKGMAPHGKIVLISFLRVKETNLLQCNLSGWAVTYLRQFSRWRSHCLQECTINQ